LQRFGQTGRDRIDRHFTIDRVIRAYETLWASVLGLKQLEADTATSEID
jgi:hypothetical protein